MNIVLIGYRGTGKTKIAAELGLRLGRKVLSTDEIIEKTLKKTIPEIVKEKGWDYFRELEEKVVARISILDGYVIDCGGGAVLREENIKNLKKNGKIFLLSSTPEKIRERIKDSAERPALKKGMSFTGEIDEVLKDRKEAYNSAADFVIDSNGSISEAAEEIIKRIGGIKNK